METAGIRNVFDPVLPRAGIAGLRQLLDRSLGRRPALEADQRDVKWWINLATISEQAGRPAALAILKLFCDTPLLAWARERLGHDLVFVLEYCILRRFDPVRRPIPSHWHFDANIFGPTTPMVNFWMPLVDVGDTAPGLTLASEARQPATLWSLVCDIPDGSDSDPIARYQMLYSRDEVTAALDATPGVTLETPQLRAGGAIAFDQQFLHGTQALTPDMGVRDSLEIRLLPLDAAHSLGLDRRYTVVKAPG